MKATRRPSWDEIRTTRTKTEKLVERLLREHYPELEFETNPQILGYLPDFHFPAQRVLLEIDGPVHDGYHPEHKDWRKDQKLKAAGYQVVRLRNADIWNDPTAAAHVIGSTLGILRDGVDQEAVWARFSRRRPRPERRA